MDIIQQFGLLFLMIVGISFMVKIVKQPIIMGYVLSGIIFAQFFTHNNDLSSMMTLFSEIGIMFLLFLMGIEFDLENLKHLGKDIFLATFFQSIIFFFMGLGITYFFPFTFMEKVHLAILFMFSSTLLVAKWVEDKKETGSLHGKIILSILVLQDIFAIIAITILSAIQGSSWKAILFTPLSSLALLVFTFIFARYLLNFLYKIAAHYPELVFILSLSICFIFAEIAALLNYSRTIGAFIGGFVLGNTIYKTDIYGKLKPLIIFFNVLFFVGLGFQIEFNYNLHIILVIILFAIASLLLKPIVIYFTLRQRGFDLKTSFLSGIYLAQLSEFGIIIIMGSVSAGLIQNSLNSIATILVILTMLLSSYFIKYDKIIFNFLLKPIEKIDKYFITKDKSITDKDIDIDAEVIFFGYYEFGKELSEKLSSMNKKMIVIENDLQDIALLKKDNIPYLFNTFYSPEFFNHIHFKNPELVISNKLDVIENKMLIKELKKHYPKIIVIVTAKKISEALELYKADADYVIYPSYINEQNVSVLLQDYTTDINKVIEKKLNDLTMFQKRAQDKDSVNKNIMQDVDELIQDIDFKTKLDIKSKFKHINPEPIIKNADSILKKIEENKNKIKEKYKIIKY